MESLNLLILIGVFISSIINLAIELEDKHTIKYEYYLRTIFCIIALSTVKPIMVNDSKLIWLFSVILAYLIYRIQSRLKELNIKKIR